MTSHTFADESPRMRPRSAFALIESEPGAEVVAAVWLDATLVAAADFPADPAASPREHATTRKADAANSTAARRNVPRERYDIVVLESTRVGDPRQSERAWAVGLKAASTRGTSRIAFDRAHPRARALRFRLAYGSRRRERSGAGAPASRASRLRQRLRARHSAGQVGRDL